jgi:hypothetical protein
MSGAHRSDEGRAKSPYVRRPANPTQCRLVVNPVDQYVGLDRDVPNNLAVSNIAVSFSQRSMSCLAPSSVMTRGASVTVGVGMIVKNEYRIECSHLKEFAMAVCAIPLGGVNR